MSLDSARYRVDYCSSHYRTISALKINFKTDLTIRKTCSFGKFEKMTEENEINETEKRGRRVYLLGLPNALLMFSSSLTGSVLTDLIVYRTCLVILKVSAADCLLLRTNSSSQEAMDLEARVEPYTSTLVMTKDLLENILPTLVALIFVPWSDRGGRRPLLLAAFGGYALTNVMLSLMSNWNISPWYLVVASIPSKLLGGISTIRIASLCYISDVTSEKDRTVQLTLLQASTHSGQLLGALIGPLIYESYGYTYVFGSASICCLSALAYTYFWIPESVRNDSNESVRGFGVISFLKGIVTMSSIAGNNFQRSLIWLAIFTLTLNALIDKGYRSIEFLFTRARLGWNVKQYSYFHAANTALHIVGLCLISIRSHISGVPDTLLLFMGFTSALGDVATKSFAWQSWHMYLALSIDILSGITTPVMRSVISKFVPAQDIGKIFSLAALLQILTSFGATPLYTFVYFHYLPPIYPSPVYLVSIGFYTLLILCVAGMEILIRKSRKPPTEIAASQEDLSSKSQ